MALTARAGAYDNVDRTSYTTAAFTPGANRKIFIAIYSRNAAGPNQPTVSGHSLTWTLVRRALATAHQVLVFEADVGASPGSAALTIDFAGQTQLGCGWSVFDTDLMGGVGQQADAFETGSTNSLTITLGTLANAASIAVGAHFHFTNEAATVGSGFTEIHDVFGSAVVMGFQTEYKLNETAVSASWATATTSFGIAFEIRADAPALVNWIT